MKILICLLTSIGAQTTWAHGISEADKAAMLSGGLLKYVSLGASHMITGYDHLLFLLAVIFFLTSAKEIVKFISIFTLGHSVTLIFATFSGISANYFLIDAVIALSVIYKGFDNNDGFSNYLKLKSPNLLWMVFLFGLIHGFGLSTRLQQLPLDEQSSGILGRIIAFNVGVEFGQIAALLLMLLVLNVWRKLPSFKNFSRLTNDLIMFIGFLLLLMQLHGYLHSKNPEEFGFDQDTHLHEHIKMLDSEPAPQHVSL